MPLEVEQKFRIANLATLEARLLALGATRGENHEQVDRYYRHPSRDFAQTDEALRLRRIGDHNYITYKGPKLDRATKTRHEIEMPLPCGENGAAQAAELLAALSFEPVLEVRKRRQHLTLLWNGTPVEIALDRVADVGEFIELEIIADEAGLPAAQATVLSLSEALGLREMERRSYLELLIAQRGRG
jgi:adenylate cyclase class 2